MPLYFIKSSIVPLLGLLQPPITKKWILCSQCFCCYTFPPSLGVYCILKKPSSFWKKSASFSTQVMSWCLCYRSTGTTLHELSSSDVSKFHWHSRSSSLYFWNWDSLFDFFGIGFLLLLSMRFLLTGRFLHSTTRVQRKPSWTISSHQWIWALRCTVIFQWNC